MYSFVGVTEMWSNNRRNRGRLWSVRDALFLGLEDRGKRHMSAPPGAFWDVPRGNVRWGGRRLTTCKSHHICWKTQTEEIICQWEKSVNSLSSCDIFSFYIWESLPWSLVSVVIATKQQLCDHVLLSWTLSIPENEEDIFFYCKLQLWSFSWS